VSVWFTCVLGNPRQFVADAESLFVADYEKVIAWCKRYPDTDVVLTHGLPWRSWLQNENTSMGVVPEKLLQVFACPRVHLQLLIPLRLGDTFDFPFSQANGMLAQLAKSIGAERLLYGTDMPMLERYCTYSQSVTHIARYFDFLTPKERALVLGGNCRRLLDAADKALEAIRLPSSLSVSPPSLSEVSVQVRMPATVGQKVESLATPCLIVDLAALEANCKTMNEALRPFSNKGFVLRPHTKPHKSSKLASKQLQEHGSVAQGVCCQTVREVEAMVRGGILDALHTNIISDRSQADRLAQLSALHGAQVGTCVDSHEVLALLKEALAASPGSSFNIMLELGVACRTGIEPEATSTTVSLAKDIVATEGLRLRGLQVYHGVSQHLRTPAERRQAISEATSVAERHLAALREVNIPAAGAPALVVSGGGTGSFLNEAETGVFSELQCGSYIFNDADYARNKEQIPWQQSLFVMGTVIGSYTRPGVAGGPHCVVDVGLKTVAFDSGVPVPLSPSGSPMEYVNLGDEHGAIRPIPGERPLAVGTRLKLQPGHCDPTVNLHDFIIGIRGDIVETIFPVDARGY